MNDNHYDSMAEAAEALHEAVEALAVALYEEYKQFMKTFYKAICRSVHIDFAEIEKANKRIKEQKLQRCCWDSCAYHYNVHERPRDARLKTHNIRNHTRRR